MNMKEWKLCTESSKYKWYNKTREIQKSLQYNSDHSAVVIHHLRDTEEQRKYNDEHYELWGHNLDGSFEYGKYVVFVTKEEHTEIHKCSEETCEKNRETAILLWKNPAIRSRIISKVTGHTVSQEARDKISAANSGRKFTEEHREKLCIARRKRIITDETKSKMSDSAKRVMSDLEHRKKISDTVKRQKQEKKALYDEYKLSCGILMWNDFQSFLKHHFKRNYVPTLSELKKALTNNDSEG